MTEISEQGYAALRGGFGGFMRERCKVSSQHKLPNIYEILDTLTWDMIHRTYGVTAKQAHDYIQMMVDQGSWFMYGNSIMGGAYLSDHPIDVL